MDNDENDNEKLQRWFRQQDAQADVRHEQDRADLRERYLSLGFAERFAFRRAIGAIEDASRTFPMLGPKFFAVSARIDMGVRLNGPQGTFSFVVGEILLLLDAWDAEIAEAG
jgi:hypothetical protein